MTLAKKDRYPADRVQDCLFPNDRHGDWSAFGTQPKAPTYLERLAAVDPDVWVQYGNREGRDVIYVRTR